MGGKRNKAHYKTSAKRHKGAELQQGAVGFMFSFAKGRERQAKSEAYELLNSYAADAVGQVQQKESDVEDEDIGSDEEDIDAAMNKQISKLKEKRKQSDLFSYQETGVNQIMFMKASIDNHHSLTYRILDDAKKGELKCNNRALHRIVPVLASCRAECAKIRECVLDAIEVYLKLDGAAVEAGTARTYKSLVKVRNNNETELSQHSIIQVVGEAIREKYSEWKVDLTDPHMYICVDILKKVACVSVLHDYVYYKKFNLQELTVHHHTAQAVEKGDTRVKRTDNQPEAPSSDNITSTEQGATDNIIPAAELNIGSTEPNSSSKLVDGPSHSGENISKPNDEIKPRSDSNIECEEGVLPISLTEHVSASDGVTEHTSASEGVTEHTSASDGVTEHTSASDGVTEHTSASDGVTEHTSASDGVNVSISNTVQTCVSETVPETTSKLSN